MAGTYGSNAVDLAPQFDIEQGPFTPLTMKNRKTMFHSTYHSLSKVALAASICLVPVALPGAAAPDLLDDFSDRANNSLGYPRLVLHDTTTGGNSNSTQSYGDGILTSTGTIVPPRGQPGWVSLGLLLTSDGSAADLSQYQGIRLKIKIKKGMLSVSANSTRITNFDFHAAIVPAGGETFKEVRIPFSAMRRAWSEQTRLDTTTIASISLVAVGLQQDSFAFEIDEIGFY